MPNEQRATCGRPPASSSLNAVAPSGMPDDSSKLVHSAHRLAYFRPARPALAPFASNRLTEFQIWDLFSSVGQRLAEKRRRSFSSGQGAPFLLPPAFPFLFARLRDAGQGCKSNPWPVCVCVSAGRALSTERAAITDEEADWRAAGRLADGQARARAYLLELFLPALIYLAGAPARPSRDNEAHKGGRRKWCAVAADNS